jgi:phosphate transport system substrate-binding protein
MNRWGLSFLILLLAYSCTEDSKRETPTEGEIRAAVDPAVMPIAKELTDAFNFRYPHGEVHLMESEESQAINDLIDGKVNLIIIPGHLPAQQTQALKTKKFNPKIQILAWDALVVVVHPNNPDTLLSLEQLQALLSGKVTQWSQVSAGNTSGKVQVILDKGGSSMSNYLRDSVLMGEAMHSGVRGAGSIPELIEAVHQTPGAIGFTGLNWISGTQDSLSKARLASVAVAHILNSEDSQYYLPFQSWIGVGKYPLKRPVNAITLEHKTGLVAGFIAYCAGEKGQRIVLKSGLLPAFKPSRWVEMREQL